jgi:Holliday junction resolvase RusA-like endonuclease
MTESVGQTIKTRSYGIPYAQLKSRGRKDGCLEWSAAVREATSTLPRVSGPCRLRVTFFLPQNKYPLDHPHGMDLDNLLKRFFDALHETIFSNVPGRDGCVSEVFARKITVTSDTEAGAELEVEELLMPLT